MTGDSPLFKTQMTLAQRNTSQVEFIHQHEQALRMASVREFGIMDLHVTSALLLGLACAVRFGEQNSFVPSTAERLDELHGCG